MRRRGPLLAADPGVPEEPGGLRQARGLPRVRRGTTAPPDADAADLVVVNTCAFIEAARQESIDTVLSLADRRRAGARLVVTGCMAERYGDELRDALPEVDLVAGFGHDLIAPAADAVRRSRRPRRRSRARTPHAARRAGGERLRPPRAAPPGRPRPVGLREGGRGLRPHLRLLRHPVVPRQAALPLARRGPGRGRRLLARHRRRRAAPARDRPRRPGPRLLRPGPLGPRPRGTPHRRRPARPSPPSPAPCRRGSSAPGCSTSIRPA